MPLMESVLEHEFRDALARWATGVTVVTARAGAEPVGMTASSLSVVSFDPPLVLLCIAASAKAHSALVGAPGFAVHVLGASQAAMSARFARAGSEKFTEHPDERGPFDVPLLPFGVARLICEHHAALDGGDHTILVGRVISTEVAETDPLLYWNRAYGRLSPSLRRTRTPDGVATVSPSSPPSPATLEGD
jgi:flavin reductase (DIM6/NTAB) family NADH-FMN oxidoreductase RutF